MSDAAPAPTTTFAPRPFSFLKLFGWLTTALLLALLFYPGYRYADDTYWLKLYSRYMALALFALSVDLVWGYTGLLSLGQGLYFGLGVYAIGYSLKFLRTAQMMDRPAGTILLPDFMEYCRLTEVPAWITP